MLAKYKGTCSKCGKLISVGEEISWSRQEGGKAYHLACAERKPAPVASAAPLADHGVSSEAELLATLKALLASKLASEASPVAPVAVAEEPTEADYAPVYETVAEKPVKTEKKAKLSDNSPWYDVLEAVLPLTSRILLVGPPSTGKSTTAIKTADTKHRITMTETTTREDLIGMFHLVDGETKFVEGPVSVAMGNGESVLVDEIDRYSPECASLLYSLIDDKPHITLPSGKSINAASGYKMVMTTNESIETLPVAVQDRIEVIIMASTPHPAALEGIPEAAKNVCMRYYEALPKRTFRMHPTVRRVRCFYHLLRNGIPSKLAANLVFGEDGSREILSVITSAEGDI